MLLTSGDDRNQLRMLARREVLDDFELLIHILYGKGPEADLLADLMEQGNDHRDDRSEYRGDGPQQFRHDRGPRRRRGGRGRSRGGRDTQNDR